MNGLGFSFCRANLCALPSGALFWPEQRTLVVSDLHLGKAARLSAVGGAQLPPFESRETLSRLDQDISLTDPTTVICLGDSFDAPGLDVHLPDDDLIWIARLQAGRRWIWIEGNHDPGPLSLGGEHHADMPLGGLVFRHIASPEGAAEVSGHYHPKARLSLRGRVITRPCFLVDEARLILPAYGTLTGGLRTDSPDLSNLMSKQARAILTGRPALAIPMPRRQPVKA